MELPHTQTLICPTHWASLPSPILFPLPPELEIISCFLYILGCLPAPGLCPGVPCCIFLFAFIHVPRKP